MQEQSTVRVLGHDWFPSINRTMSFWHQTLSVKGQNDNIKDFGIKTRLHQLVLVAEGIHTDIFHNHDMENANNKAVFEYLNSRENVISLKNRYKRFAKELLASLSRCNERLNVKNFEDFNEKYTRFCAGLYITVAIGRHGSFLLSEDLRKKGIKEGDIPKIISSITYPRQHTPLFNSQLDMLEIAKGIQKNKLSEKQTEARLRLWLKKYSHIPVNFCGDPWSIEDAREQLKNALKKDCTKEIISLEKIHKDRTKEAKTILRDLKNKRIALLSYILSEGTILNEFRKNVFSRVSLEFRPMFAKIVKMSGSDDWKDCFYLKPEEMIRIVKGKKVDFNKIKQERKLAGITIGKNEKVVSLNMEDCQKLFDFINELKGKSGSEQTTATFVKGFSANKGIITGKAKIILNPKDFSKLEPGDILVTTMTSVDFIPIMEKAGAFVTNEGGITCHASIVSREMNKPCIIGTKIATKVFKDGDIVEVDANIGVARRI